MNAFVFGKGFNCCSRPGIVHFLLIHFVGLHLARKPAPTSTAKPGWSRTKWNPRCPKACSFGCNRRRRSMRSRRCRPRNWATWDNISFWKSWVTVPPGSELNFLGGLAVCFLLTLFEVFWPGWSHDSGEGLGERMGVSWCQIRSLRIEAAILFWFGCHRSLQIRIYVISSHDLQHLGFWKMNSVEICSKRYQEDEKTYESIVKHSNISLKYKGNEQFLCVFCWWVLEWLCFGLQKNRLAWIP